MIDIKTIKPNPNNPRVIKDDKFKKLVASVKDFPKMLSLRPMVVNDDNILLGGNMRLAALKEAGYKEIPDEWVKQAKDLTEEEQKEFIIKDNVGFGEWDWDIIANEWDADLLEDWGLDIPGTQEIPDEGNFDDPGIQDKSQFGVIVICQNEDEQESTFEYLRQKGYTCKIVVT